MCAHISNTLQIGIIFWVFSAEVSRVWPGKSLKVSQLIQKQATRPRQAISKASARRTWWPSNCSSASETALEYLTVHYMFWAVWINIKSSLLYGKRRHFHYNHLVFALARVYGTQSRGRSLPDWCLHFGIMWSETDDYLLYVEKEWEVHSTGSKSASPECGRPHTLLHPRRGLGSALSDFPSFPLLAPALHEGLRCC